MAINASLQFAFKDMYDDESVHDVAMRDHPFMMDLKKVGRFGGKTWHYATQYGNPQGVSGTFSTAQTNATLSKGVDWTLNRKPKYGCITIPGEDILSAEVGKDSAYIVDLVSSLTDATLEEHGDALAFELPRDGSTARGRIASIATNVLTLLVKDDARNFKVGMTVVADDTADGSSLRGGGSGLSTTVAAIDEDLGTVTLTNASLITGLAVNDYLFRQGDPGTGIEGLQKIFPLTAPVFGSDSFRGNDRGTDPARLAGVRLNDTSMQPEEAIARIAVRISQVGRMSGRCTAWINSVHFNGIAKRLNAKVEYAGAGGKADYSFSELMIHTVKGPIKVKADPDFPVNLGYVLEEGNFIKHLGGLPHIIQDDGKVSLRSVSADSIEARTRSFANLVCPKPGNNGVFSIASSGL